MGHLVSSSQPRMAHSLSACTGTQKASCGHCFPFFLRPLASFLIFKENSPLLIGDQLRRSLAAQRAQQSMRVLGTPFPGRRLPPGKFSNCPAASEGPVVGPPNAIAEEEGKGSRFTNSQTHVTTQTQAADAVAAAVFSATRPLSPSCARFLGSLSCSVTPHAWAKDHQGGPEGDFELPSGPGEVNASPSFSSLPPSPAGSAWALWTGNSSSTRMQAGLSSWGKPVAIIVFHTQLPTLPPFPPPIRRLAKPKKGKSNSIFDLLIQS